jgi:hypothetical protein
MLGAEAVILALVPLLAVLLAVAASFIPVILLLGLCAR